MCYSVPHPSGLGKLLSPSVIITPPPSQTPLSEADPVVSWTSRHIDLGREASIMHSTLTNQLKSIKLPELQLQKLDSLVALLLQLSKSQEDDIEDPFSSTFEALRVMQTTISTFNTDRENSESSSEYNTPATSPAHEQSPPPPEGGDAAKNTLGSAAQVRTCVLYNYV